MAVFALKAQVVDGEIQNGINFFNCASANNQAMIFQEYQIDICLSIQGLKYILGKVVARFLVFDIYPVDDAIEFLVKKL